MGVEIVRAVLVIKNEVFTLNFCIFISSKDVWTIGELNIRALYLHKVVFYMEKQPDPSSYIALDDLTMLSHRCQTPVSLTREKLPSFLLSHFFTTLKI